MVTKTKGGCGSYKGGGGKNRRRNRQKQVAKIKDEEKTRANRIDAKALAKEQRNKCPAELKAEEKQATTRQQKRQQQEEKQSHGMTKKEQRKGTLAKRKEASSLSGKGQLLLQK